MKQIALTLITTLLCQAAVAKCMNRGFDVFPKSSRISTNSLFVLEAFGASRFAVDSLELGYSVYLESSAGPIPLRVESKHYGQYGATQLVLKTCAPLVTNARYYLILKHPSGELRAVMRIGSDDPVEWVASNNDDTTAPVWESEPVAVGESVQLFGCGPSVFVNYLCGAYDESGVLVQTTVANASTGETLTYYLELKKGLVAIGHNMCFGAFSFKEGHLYRVKFQLMDTSGNLSRATEEYTFAGPTIE
jgi:hypothetical protein